MQVRTRDLNWRVAHAKTQLDDLVTPLCAASFQGRTDCVRLILDNPSLLINMVT